MLRRLAAALLTLALLAVGAPYALAAQSFSARTPLAGVGGDKRENSRICVGNVRLPDLCVFFRGWPVSERSVYLFLLSGQKVCIRGAAPGC